MISVIIINFMDVLYQLFLPRTIINRRSNYNHTGDRGSSSID